MMYDRDESKTGKIQLDGCGKEFEVQTVYGVYEGVECGDVILCPSCTERLQRNRNWLYAEHGRILTAKNKLNMGMYKWKARTEELVRMVEALLNNSRNTAMVELTEHLATLQDEISQEQEGEQCVP